MKNQVYFGIAIRIIVLFSLSMLFTYISEHLRDFFGDIHQRDRSGCIADENWIWGSRHYWFFWMMFLLFILSAINFVLATISLVEKHYPTK